MPGGVPAAEEKAHKQQQAIADVAKENGYSYIFDVSAGALLYQPDSDDILPLVKKKLGLK